MPKLHIHAIHSQFSARDDGIEYEKTNVAIEVRIEQADGTPLLRSVVSLSVAALLPIA
jgi:hypothetical protein